ncbi:hypothetical protein DdX_17986 [Ditylenchus destructor]|uniref:Uncharacterized protein n=1 Tax=Ditylenchus destructor TaxID=166010 RepID=A0AAD4MQE0_9BILA|nr:hypothetical protein DdX_17986 [Ditylenchus destructor]
MNEWILLSILKFLGRNELELLQVTNRLIDTIIRQSFKSKPFRIPPSVEAKIQIKDGELLVQLRNWNTSECLKPNDREWKHHDCGVDCGYFYRLNEMSPFWKTSVRFGKVNVLITSPCSPDHIAEMESISHTWIEQVLHVWSPRHNETSLRLILESTAMFGCRTLSLMDSDTNTHLLRQPNLYALHAIDYEFPVERDQMLNFIRQKALFPESDTILILTFFSGAEFKIVLEVIRKEFLASSQTCRLRFIIKATFHEESMQFSLENNRTKEVLQLKYITEKEAEDTFDLCLHQDLLILLERIDA